MIQRSPRAGCAQKAALKEDVEQLLDFVMELIRKERDVLREDNHAALIPIVEELGLALDEQAGLIAAFGQHKKEHGC